jgi:hydroxymethylbilane synthase
VVGREGPVKIRIGTRRSRLAVAQAREVAARLEALGAQADLVPMVTSGDRGAPARDSPAGVKGLFVAEIVRALQGGEVELAVHSAKDLPSQDPEGVVVGAVPERADPFDVLVTRDGGLGPGSVVGTSSLRRQAQLRRAHPEIQVRDIRGNVDTRLAKLDAREVDGLVLAAAGLARLGISPPTAVALPLEEMVPAPGQGALAAQVRADDEETLEMIRRLDHPPSRAAFDAERSLVARVGGGCALPLGAYAEEREGGIRLLAVVIRPDGSDLVWAQAEAHTPDRVADEVAGMLFEGGAREILAQARTEAGEAAG